MDDGKMTMDECANRYHVTVRTLQNWMTGGYKGVVLESVREGRRVYITPAAFDKFTEECAVIAKG